MGTSRRFPSVPANRGRCKPGRRTRCKSSLSRRPKSFTCQLTPLGRALPSRGRKLSRSGRDLPDTEGGRLYGAVVGEDAVPVSYTHLRAHETKANLVCRLLLEKKKKTKAHNANVLK